MTRPDVWMPLFVPAYLRDTTHLSTEQHGAYMLLLMTAWTRGGRLPNDEAQLAQIVKADRKAWSRVRGPVLAFFTPDGDSLVQKRLSEEWEKAVAYHAKQRTNGSKGGRPKATQEKPMGFSRDTPGGNPGGGPPESPVTVNQNPQVYEEPSTTTEPCSPAPAVASSPPRGDVPLTRAAELARLLARLEAERGIAPQQGLAFEPHVLTWWASAGVRDEDIRQAHAMAAAARVKSGDAQQAISLRFLDIFLTKVLAPEQPPGSAVVPVARKADVCCCCGAPASKRIGAEWFCSRHSQHDRVEAA